MKFTDIDDALIYLMNKVEGENVKYDSNLLDKTKNLLTKFIHNPKLSYPEIRSYDEESLLNNKNTHLRNKIANNDAYSIKLFDYEYKVVYFVTFGDIYSDGLFKMEIDMFRMKTHEIKSNAEALELLEEYKREVKYDTMNDTWDYHRRYHAMKGKKETRDSEILKMFENFTFIY